MLLGIFNTLGLGWFVASYGHPEVGWLTSVMVLVLVLLLVHFYCYKNWSVFVGGAIAITATLPAINQILMGGFVGSAGTAYWMISASIYAVVGFQTLKPKLITLGVIVGITLILGFIEPWVGQDASRFPGWVEGYLYANTMITLMVFIAVTLNFYMQKLFQEKSISESLLLNILPQSIAEELKVQGESVPKLYQNVTVVFADIKGFTHSAHQLSPQAIVGALNDCFLAFDQITMKHRFEKIKTIGDAYMCAGGVPTPLQDHAIQAVEVGIAMLQFMQQWRQQSHSYGPLDWDLRVGIHTGEVIAGVIGEQKFAYDIWGDTVNVASRMESYGEAGKINISKDVYDLVKHHFSCESRGRIPVKNRGEIEMYFVQFPSSTASSSNQNF